MVACRFCEIDPQRNYVLKRYEYVFVMLSNPRLMPCHLLVVPNRHVEEPWQLESHEREQIFNITIALQERIVIHAKLAPWVDICQHYRPSLPEGDEKVNHYHMHLRPRQPYDSLYLQAQVGESALFRAGMLSPAQMIAEGVMAYSALYS